MGVLVVGVVGERVLDVEDEEEAARCADAEAHDVNADEKGLTAEPAQRDLEVVPEHKREGNR